MRLIILIAILFLIIAISNSLPYRNERFEPLPSLSTDIPKVIWAFWENERDVPDTVIDCIATWRKTQSDYQIILLTKDTAIEYIPEDVLKLKFSNTPARLSDFIRLNLLYRYGGIWIDASTILIRSLNDLLRLKSSKQEYIGFYLERSTTDRHYPIIENWFMAASYGSEFIRLWLIEFMRINDFDTPEDYVNDVRRKGIDLQNITDTTYLTMHVAVQRVLQDLKFPLNRLLLLKAEDGPFRYLFENDWNDEKGLRTICDGASSITPIIKIIRFGRKVLEGDSKLRKCIFNRVNF